MAQQVDTLINQAMDKLRVTQDIKYRDQVVLSRADTATALNGDSESRRQSHAVAVMDHYDAEYQSSIGINRIQVVSQLVQACEHFGRRILDKYFVKKSNDGAPVTFKYGDLLFNMAANYELDDEVVERMIKNVGNELQAIQYLQSMHGEEVLRNVNTALLCFIDYYGFRLVCYPTMPLSG